VGVLSQIYCRAGAQDLGLGVSLSAYLRLRIIYLRIKHDPRRYEYTDAAITPVTEDEIKTHKMFQNKAARPRPSRRFA
jgi:hypothetical protein